MKHRNSLYQTRVDLPFWGGSASAGKAVFAFWQGSRQLRRWCTPCARDRGGERPRECFGGGEVELNPGSIVDGDALASDPEMFAAKTGYK